ncbi:ABC transporter, permease protein [Lachnospiraceae bacterium KM106-2]|nr:ABC transporter, permease protein [Lachnospiraceae bacterium KM106-2]
MTLHWLLRILNILIGVIPGAVSQGVLWSLMSLGVYITFKVLDFADMTVDGSFALGGAICASMILKGWNPFIAILCAIIAGLLAGMITGFLNTSLRIPAILAGILTQLSLYSINLRIMGRANLPLLNSKTMFDLINGMIQSITGTRIKAQYLVLVVGILCAILVIGILYWFFGTEIGSAIRATGNNEKMMRALGQNTNHTKVVALMLSNGLVALSGALVCMDNGYGDVGMGTGAIVIGLASIVIGEVLLKYFKSFGMKLIAVVVGSILYRIVVAVVLQLGMNADDMKLLTAILVAFALAVPVIAEKFRERFGKLDYEYLIEKEKDQ